MKTSILKLLFAHMFIHFQIVQFKWSTTPQLIPVEFDVCLLLNDLTWYFDTDYESPNMPTSDLITSLWRHAVTKSLVVWMQGKSVMFCAESPSKSTCTSDSKMDIFRWLSNIYIWRIYMWNVSYAFRKRTHSSKQHVSVSGSRSLSVRASDGPSRFKLKL